MALFDTKKIRSFKQKIVGSIFMLISFLIGWLSIFGSAGEGVWGRPPIAISLIFMLVSISNIIDFEVGILIFDLCFIAGLVLSFHRAPVFNDIIEYWPFYLLLSILMANLFVDVMLVFDSKNPSEAKSKTPNPQNETKTP